MKKFWLCLLAALLIPAFALGAARMPAQRGTVTDDADVLSAQTASDIAAYAEKVEEEAGIRLHVAAVHFLDGMDVQSYADTLFARWELGDDDMLLLAAAGEDACATAMGDDVKEALGQSNAENLMYTSSSFAALLRSQQYDAAFQAYYPALNALLAKQTGAEIRLGSLFGAQSIVLPSAPIYASDLWSEVMEAIEDSGEEYQKLHESREQQDNGITAGGWIVLVILIVIVLRQSKGRRRSNRRGCGCSPLGWIFGLLGLGFLFNRD